MFHSFIKGRLSTIMLLAGVAAMPLTLGSGQSWAQAAADDEDVMEEVVVTGSRIKRAKFDTMHPTTIIDSEFLDDRGYTNIADALNEGPQFSVSNATPVNRQGRESVGQNFVNFFGIGTQRTLTLVNGRRFVSSNAPVAGSTPGLQVDLNNIPTGLVDRIETVAVGGAPIYGADAIAGTVNIILKQNFEGVESDIQYGNIADKGGDARNTRTRLTVGGNFSGDRGNAVVSFEYNKVDGLIQADRPDTARMQAFLSLPGSATPLTLVDGLRFIVNSVGGAPLVSNFFPKFVGIAVDGTPVDMPGEDILTFAPDGSLTTFDMGGLTTTPFQSFGFGDGLALEQRESLFAPSERFLITALGHYDINPWITGRMELWYNETQNEELINQIPGFSRGLFFDGEGGALRIPLSNPFLDPGSAATIFNALSDPTTGAAINPTIDVDGDGIADSFYLTKRGEDLLGEGGSTRNATLLRFVVGFDGQFELGGRALDWELTYNFGRSQANTRQLVLFDALLINGINAVALQDAADVAAFQNFFNLRSAERVEPVTARAIRPGTNELIGPDGVQIGDIVCAATLNPPTQSGNVFGLRDRDPTLDQCIPVNLFGAGNIHPEALERIRLPSNNRTFNQQQVFSFNTTGNVFDLPAGPLGVAVGYEHRAEIGRFLPDGLTSTSFGRGVPSQKADGQFNTNEFYAETLIPLISEDMGIPFAEHLEAELAVRRVRNSLAGSATTWTAGGRWSPFEDITLRGNFTRSIRSPGILELFLPTSQTINFAQDPCDTRFIDTGPIAGARRANCTTAGIPDPFTSIIVNGSRAQTISGDPNLQNEVADAWTVGAVITPRWLPGLSLAIDWVNISLTNAIEILDGTAVLNACFDVAPSNFSTGSTQCSKVTRGAPTLGSEAFQIQDIVTGFTNAGLSRYAGLNVVLEYGAVLDDLFPGVGDVGAIQISGNYNYIDDQILSITGFDINPQRGEIGRSKHRFNINTRWNRHELGFLMQTRWIGPAVFNAAQPGLRDVNGVGAWVVFNTTVNYQLTENVGLRGIVQNVFNVNAPRGAALDSGDATSNGGQTVYLEGILGRRFTIAANVKF